MKKQQFAIYFGLIYLTIIAASCNNKATTETDTEADSSTENIVSLNAEQAKSANIATQTCAINAISTTIQLNGIIDVPPQNIISVSMPLGGYLKSTKLLPGMHISKGEVIAIMEDQQYIQLQQDYLVSKAKLNYAAADYERQKELSKTQSNSDKTLQLANMEYQTLRITVNALSEKLKLININPSTLSEHNISKSVSIRSPINGFVAKINVNIGKYVNPADILFELVNPEDIHLNLKVFEKDIDKLSIGQTLLAYTNTKPETKFPCSIILVSKSLNEDRSIDVHCHFDKYNKSLLPGMYMNAVVELKNHQAQTLPEEAIINFEGNHFVFVQKSNNQYEMKSVAIGVKENNLREILNAQDFKNQQIVTVGAYTLLMKLKNKEEEE